MRNQARLLRSLIIVTVMISVVFFFMQITETISKDDFNKYWYPVQGFFIQTMLIDGYYRVYQRQAEYHRVLLARYKHHMTCKEIEDVKNANRETCVFFTYICQFMFVYMIYAGVKLVFQYYIDPNQSIIDRVIDITDVAL